MTESSAEFSKMLGRVIAPASDSSFDFNLRCLTKPELKVLRGDLFSLFARVYAEPPRFELWNESDFDEYYQPISSSGFCLAAFDKHDRLVAFVSALPLNRTEAEHDFGSHSLPSGSWYVSDITVDVDHRGRRIGTCLLSILLGILCLGGVPAVTARTRVDVPPATNLLTSHGFPIVDTISSCMHNIVSNKHLHVLDIARYADRLNRFSCYTPLSVTIVLLAETETDARRIVSALSGSESVGIVRLGPL
jgi:ribosomal protein S18 acetylase RimI-like enzyme